MAIDTEPYIIAPLYRTPCYRCNIVLLKTLRTVPLLVPDDWHITDCSQETAARGRTVEQRDALSVAVLGFTFFGGGGAVGWP